MCLYGPREGASVCRTAAWIRMRLLDPCWLEVRGFRYMPAIRDCFTVWFESACGNHGIGCSQGFPCQISHFFYFDKSTR